MKKAWIALGVLVGLVVLVVLIGYALPAEHTASRSARVRKSPRETFDVIRDVASGPAWRRDLARVEVLAAPGGKVRFREEGRHGAILFEIEADDAPRRLVTRIADEALPFGGTWTYELEPDGSGTRVTITERGVVKNPVFRFMSRFVFGHAATIEAYLEDLGKRLGEA
jgi:hypothetical protein